ncbi:MAG: hypothetical protein L0229_17665 [Blastocatellia bacterium]|nr:hypothetical protein [Blastocatellia bacterium]
MRLQIKSVCISSRERRLNYLLDFNRRYATRNAFGSAFRALKDPAKSGSR